MPTVWGFVAITQLGVVNSDLDNIRRRYCENTPNCPVFERGCGGKTPLFREEYLIRYGKEKKRMNMRNYFAMFKNEPDVLTVPDVIRLLRMGKNTVYKLLKDGAIGSIKQGKKIIVPKVCLVEFLTDAGNYQTPSPTVPNNLWTCDGCCDSVGVAREDKGQFQKKGA